MKSNSLNHTTGVPQGSILWPLLIYINDISEASKMFNFVIYADDTNLNTTLELVARQHANDDINTIMNNELDKISDWLKTKKLSLNVQKSKYIIFHQPQKKIKTLQLSMDDTEIEKRRAAWKQPPLPAERGVLFKYASLVKSASEGCVTD